MEVDKTTVKGGFSPGIYPQDCCRYFYFEFPRAARLVPLVEFLSLQNLHCDYSAIADIVAINLPLATIIR